ncbi:unannotated protein [freshwater metagenome]|uniref:Unannotated protein n=1 Tax=freshwater metagenome TaxID=449393 RepID=A0A6J6M935_9ZZZZ
MYLKPSFEDLYTQNVDRIFAFCAARVGLEQAEDLTADVFCKALAAWDRFEDRGFAPRAWLMQIAYHSIIETWRLNARLAPVAVLEGIGQDVALIVENFEEYEMALTKLKDLPERQQTVITLRFLSELSVAEVATVLEISQEAVRSATFRGVQALRDSLVGSTEKV